MSLTPAQLDVIAQTARELREADPCNGERGQIVRRTAAGLGVSENTLYGWLKKHTGWNSGRKPREDRGEICAPLALCKKVSGLVFFGTRANGKRTMTIKRAVAVLAAQGEGVVSPETGEVTMPSTATISRAMRQHGCHPDQLKKGKPTGQVRSLHPNHVWQIDASVCVLYYIKGSKAVGVMDERRFNVKKPGNLVGIKNKRVVRYLVTDHTSGAFYLRYEQSSGENALGVLSTVIEFMSDRGPQDPAHGVPDIIYTDPGAGNTAALMVDFCDQLGIRLIHHAPGAANATGSVEAHQNIVEREFEGRQRFHAVPDLVFLQAEADRWRRHYLATAVLRRHGETRNQAWLSIPADKLRTVDRDVLLAIAQWQNVTRKVGNDFVISVETRTHYGTLSYDLRELAYHGLTSDTHVRVRLNPFKAPVVTVILEAADGTERFFDVEPISEDKYGQNLAAPVFGESFRSLPDSHTDKMLKEIKMEAYSTDSIEEAEKAFKAGKTPYAGLDIMADVRDAPLYLRKPGAPADIVAPVAEAAPVSRVQFAIMMQREHPEAWNAGTAEACMEWLKVRYPEHVPGNKLDDVAERLCELFAPKRAARLSFPTSEERSAQCLS